jgi:hypothetical protein
VSFMNATFSRDASFERAEFRTPGAPAGAFDSAVFRGAALFGEAVELVNVDPSEDSARFDGAARFFQTTFEGPAYFRGVSFGFATLFNGAVFHDRAEFAGAFFDGSAQFADATFKSDVSFRHTRFGGYASFGGEGLVEVGGGFGAVFERNAAFHGSTFNDYAHFGHAEFRAGAYFTATTFAEGVKFDHVLFAGDASFDESRVAGLADFPFTTFEGRARLTALGWDAARFEDTRFAQPSTVTGREDEPSPVRILSLRRAEVGALLLGNVDLRACRFDGARNLDQLRLGARVVFASPPPVRRWTRRRVLAEESMWRAARPSWRNQGWYPPESQLPEGLDAGETLPEPRIVAQLYRELRKGREDQRAEPAAADFYYGEMEMRRHDPEVTRSERAIISIYWVLSGYALRSSRAFAWLVAVLVVFAVLFAAFGFEEEQSWLRAVFVSITATAFRRVEDIRLTFGGEVLSAVLQIVGPLLLALALFSIRGRVKR